MVPIRYRHWHEEKTRHRHWVWRENTREHTFYSASTPQTRKEKGDTSAPPLPQERKRQASERIDVSLCSRKCIEQWRMELALIVESFRRASLPFSSSSSPPNNGKQRAAIGLRRQRDAAPLFPSSPPLLPLFLSSFSCLLSSSLHCSVLRYSE